MKNYKVEATMKFTDKEENVKRNVGDVFEVTELRYKFLKSNNAVKLIETIEEISEEEVQAVASAIVEEAEEQNKSVEEVVNEIIEESKEEIIEKPKKKKSSKK